MTWEEKYMKNLVSIETLNKLIQAGKLTQEEVDNWIEERGY